MASADLRVLTIRMDTFQLAQLAPSSLLNLASVHTWITCRRILASYILLGRLGWPEAAAIQPFQIMFDGALMKHVVSALDGLHPTLSINTMRDQSHIGSNIVE